MRVMTPTERAQATLRALCALADAGAGWIEWEDGRLAVKDLPPQWVHEVTLWANFHPKQVEYANGKMYISPRETTEGAKPQDREALELIRFRVFEMSKVEAESPERPWKYQNLLRFFHDVRLLATTKDGGQE